MNSTKPEIDINTNPDSTPAAPLRVLLLADNQAIDSWGPALRRIAIGLMDEVQDLTLLCQGRSPLLKYMPCPPVRVICETCRYLYEPERLDIAHRQIQIRSPRIRLWETLFPQKQAQRLAPALAAYKPTLIHALSEKQARLAEHLSCILRIPYIISVLSRKQKILPNLKNDQCSMILPSNTYQARKIRLQHPDIARKIRSLPIGTHIKENISCFATSKEVAQILTCGPLLFNHGFEELIQVVKRMEILGHAIDLVISGQGPAERELRRLVHHLKLEGIVHFTPPISAILASSDPYKTIFQTADIFVQPWTDNTQKPQLLEAMSVGLAVIAALDPHSDVIIKNKTALTVSMQKEGDLTAALEKLLRDRNNARQLAAQGQAYLRRHFLVSHMIQHLTRFYRHAVRQKKVQDNNP